MATTPSASNDAPAQQDGAVGKGRATPSRAEQEAARRRPLVPDTKEAKARAKADVAKQREKARVGMAAGDDRYLTARDKGPQRRWVRDWIDAGWHIGEAVMPLMVVVIVLTFLPFPEIVLYAFVGLWIFIFIIIADMIVTSIRVKRAARAKWGDKTERGLGWYAAMRTIQMRFMRLPKPQVKRGEYPA